MRLIHPAILQIRAPAICFYALRDSRGLILIDGGFIGAPRLLSRALRRSGWQDEPIQGIVVTHGHLDHILNVNYLAKKYHAWIAAPRLDADYYVGKAKYTGKTRITGWLEAVGRPLLAFRRFTPDHWLADGDVLDVANGLTAVHLPGHTAGHMGFWWEQERLLFSGDLFVSYGSRAQFPLNILNANPSQIRPSALKALALKPAGILPNHCDAAEPPVHVKRLEQLLERHTLAPHAGHS